MISPGGDEAFFFLDGKNIHCGDVTRSAFFTKSPIFAESYLLVGIEIFNSAFLLKKALKPNLPNGMSVSERLEKGGRTVPTEINGTDK